MKVINVGCIKEEYDYIENDLGEFTVACQGLKSEDGKMIDVITAIDKNGETHYYEFCVDSFFHEMDINKRIYGLKDLKQEVIR